MSNPNKTPENNTFSTTEQWGLVIGVDETGEIAFDPKDSQRLFLEFKDQPYPVRFDAYDNHSEGLFLELTHNSEEKLRVPKNSTTLSTILNEAAGTTDSFETAPDESRTIKILSALFGNLGHKLLIFAEQEKKLPKKIEYGQVLVEKNTLEAILLPPITLKTVETPAQIHGNLTKLANSLGTSMLMGATTYQQLHLAETLQEPIKKAIKGNK